MKHVYILFIALIVCASLNAQTPSCTISGFDVCTGASPVTSFTNASLVSGTSLTVGAKYKFSNITSGIDPLDAIVTVDSKSNASLLVFDDDNAADETGVAGTQAALFSPKIVTDADLKGNARRGYVQFTITFYSHYNGNTLPPSGTLPVLVSNLNFLHFDMDGNKIGSNGYFKEIGYVKIPSAGIGDLLNYGAPNSELATGGTVSDGGSNWLLTYGSTIERDGISRCAQVIEKSVFALPQSSVTLRMGYDYKPVSPYANQNAGRPQRQYGSKFGCFSIPNAAVILPVSLLSFAVNYNAGVATLNWSTAQEVNLSRYEIQRSLDGINFQAIGSVISRNSLLQQHYSFQDEKLAGQIIYYRLRMVDEDQSAKFSNIVVVKLSEQQSTSLTLMPNPASASTQLKFSAETGGLATIMVYDAAGKIVLKQQSLIMAGNNSISLTNVVGLSNGMYTVKVSTSTQQLSSRLIIWK